MASAKNKVIAGDYEKKNVSLSGGKAIIDLGGWPIHKKIQLDKTTVDSYEVVDESSKKSTASAVGRAAVVGTIINPVVGLAAAFTAKSKRSHVVAIQFKDGKKSLLEVDDKIYKAIMTKVF